MTLANGLVHGSRSYLWTDTAWWDPATGEIVAYGSKAFRLHTWPAACVMSLHGDDPHSIPAAVGSAWPGDVDELLAATVDALRAFCLRGGSNGFGRVLIATNLDRPRLHIVASDGAGLGAPFEPVELLSLTSSGNQTAAYKRAIARGFTPKRMRRVIDAQLAEPFDGEGELAKLGRRPWFGGNIVELEVSRAGVEDRVLRAVRSNLESEAA